MVVGVAVIGAVAAIVALAVALRVAFQEERAFEADAEPWSSGSRRASLESTLSWRIWTRACKHGRPPSATPLAAAVTSSSGRIRSTQPWCL
jgi:hypothetical protein